MAFIMYTNDNRLLFPGPAQRDPPPEYAWDWVYYRADRDVNPSPIGPYLGGQQGILYTSILICPSNEVTLRPNTYRGGTPYPFSYDLNVILAGFTSGVNGKSMRMTQVLKSSEKSY